MINDIYNAAHDKNGMSNMQCRDENNENFDK